MNAGTIIAAVTGVLSLVETALPLIGGSNGAAIAKVIGAIEGIVPVASTVIGDTYTGVKNVIEAVSEHPATTDEQLATLQALDKQVDDAWSAVEKSFDPDAG